MDYVMDIPVERYGLRMFPNEDCVIVWDNDLDKPTGDGKGMFVTFLMSEDFGYCREAWSVVHELNARIKELVSA